MLFPSYSYNSPISDPGSHSKLFSPPTHYGSCLAFFFARRFQLKNSRLAFSEEKNIPL